MCGIVAAVGQRDVPEILLEGLRRLEYRGYDSAGLAVIDGAGKLRVCKRQGKVAALESALDSGPIAGRTGIAHTRWATHGAPSEINAHPHTSGERIALVHNGIIENHQELRDELEASGVVFSSETDTEVVVHLIAAALAEGGGLFEALQQVVPRLQGAYALAVVDAEAPDRLVVARVAAS